MCVCGGSEISNQYSSNERQYVVQTSRSLFYVDRAYETSGCTNHRIAFAIVMHHLISCSVCLSDSVGSPSHVSQSAITHCPLTQRLHTATSPPITVITHCAYSTALYHFVLLTSQLGLVICGSTRNHPLAAVGQLSAASTNPAPDCTPHHIQ